jgi:hypothetical protein
MLPTTYISILPLRSQTGDYVRAEAAVPADPTGAGGACGVRRRVVRKDESLNGLLAVRVMTNRKTRWQQHGAAQADK